MSIVPNPSRLLFHPLVGADPQTVAALKELSRANNYRASIPHMVSRLYYTLRRKNRPAADARPTGPAEISPFKDPALFIVGPWRSGTTLLHELLANDRRFFTCRNVDAIFPGDPERHLRERHYFINRISPTNRMIDRVTVTANSPQEEDFAMAQLGAPSMFLAFYFPSMRDAFLTESLFFKGLRPDARDLWMAHHGALSRRLRAKYRQIQGDGATRLLLKSPGNSARISTIRALYDAPYFVRIDRPVEEIVPSLTRTINTLTDRFALETGYGPVDDRYSADLVDRVNAALDTDWRDLPEARKVAVDYQTLKGDPLAAIDHIYDALGIRLPPGQRNRIAAFWEQTARGWRRPAGAHS